MELRRSLLLPYAAEDMFDLIEQAENYPLFLPWCKSVTIHERTDDIVAARIEFSYLKVRFGFTTRNPKQRPYALQVRLVEGPFKHMHCDWQFTPLAGLGCRVSFHMAYEISERVLDKVAAPAVNVVSKSMVDAFVRRAQATLKEITPGSATLAAPPAPLPQVAPTAALAPATAVPAESAGEPPAAPLQAAPSLPAPASSPAPAARGETDLDPVQTPVVAAPLPARESLPLAAAPAPESAPALPSSTEPTAMNEAAVETPLITALRDSRLAQDLLPDQLQVLATVVRLEAHPARALLQKEGSSGNSLYVIVEGALAIVKSVGSPEETLISTLNKGDFAHELGFLDGNVRYASLVAHTDARVLVLEREGLESLIDSHPRIVYRVMCNIVRTVHRIQSRLAVQATELTNYIVKQHGRY